LRIWSIVVALLALPTAASAASFDCGKARSFTEKAICADEELSRLDEGLARLYASSIAATSGKEKIRLQRDQREWLKAREACTNALCIKTSYLERIAELQRSSASQQDATSGPATCLSVLASIRRKGIEPLVARPNETTPNTSRYLVGGAKLAASALLTVEIVMMEGEKQNVYIESSNKSDREVLFEYLSAIDVLRVETSTVLAVRPYRKYSNPNEYDIHLVIDRNTIHDCGPLTIKF
jgi:uncharacterized protein